MHLEFQSPGTIVHAASPMVFLSAPLGFLMALFSLMTPVFAGATRDFTDHEGYLSSVEGERDTLYSDMVLLSPPSEESLTLREQIFDDKLSREFRESYEDKFGRTEVERVYFSPNRFTYYDDLYGGFEGSERQISDARRDFAEYMMKRLAEYHVDNFAKSDPNVRPLWEAKERLSQVKLQVRRVKFDVRYSIAGNTVDLKVSHPWLSLSRVRLQMDTGAIGPTDVREAIVSVGRPVTSTIAIEGHVYLVDGSLSLIARKSLARNLSGSLTLARFTNDTEVNFNGRNSGAAGTGIEESVLLSGIRYVF